MSDKPWAPKDPDEVKDYGNRWAPSLADQNGGPPDTLAQSEWIIEPAGLVIDSDTFDPVTGITTVWFSGGELGVTYLCTNRIVSIGGRRLDWTKKLKMKEK